MARRAFFLFAVCLLALGCRRSPHASKPSTAHARWVFIDGGANVGQTVLAFEKSTLFSKHPWSIVSFEPNPGLVPKIPKRPNLTVREEAIWTKDETLEFQFSEEETLGGSVLPTVVQLPKMKSVKVKAIDFGQWLKRTYRKEDVVYLKLDIEGAEYPVLDQMLKDGSIAWVDRLYVEFHGAQQATSKATQAELLAIYRKESDLVQAISGLGIAVSLHHNDEPQGSYFDFDPTKYGQPW